MSDTTILIRDKIRDGITDPESASRSGNEKFVMTSFPRRDVKYPVIIVQSNNISTLSRLGMRSELQYLSMPVEIQVWARSVKERDELSQDILDYLRSIQTDASTGSINAKLFGYLVNSAVNVDEPGEEGPRKKIINVEYKIIVGG